MKRLLFFSIVALLLPLSVFAQKEAELQSSVPFLRNVYWLHDLNEDIPSPKRLLDPPFPPGDPRANQFGLEATSRYWNHYGAEALFIAGNLVSPYPSDCPPVEGRQIISSYFKATRQMSPRFFHYHTDPYVPPFLRVDLSLNPPRLTAKTSFFHTPNLTRETIGNSRSLSGIADSLRSLTQMSDFNRLTLSPELLPIAIGHGAATNILRDIEQKDRAANELRFGAVIGIGSTYNGSPIVKAIETGKLKSFNAKAVDALDGGDIKFRDALIDKVGGFIIGLFLSEYVKQAAESVQKLLKPVVGVRSFDDFGLAFIDFGGQTFFGKYYSDFHDFIEGSYSPKAMNNATRAMPNDMKPGSPFLTQQSNYVATAQTPAISLNGVVKREKAYFEAAFYSLPANHSQYLCIDDTKNTSNGPGSDVFYNNAVAYYSTAKIAAPVTYGVIAAAVAAYKIYKGIGPPPDPWSLLSGIYGIYTSIIKIDEIAKKYEKGEKWLKEEANAGWVEMIGAYRDETYIIRRRVDPCLRRPRSEPDDCNDEPYFEDFTATRRIYEDSDALVPLASQRNPREPNWTPAITNSELNLEVKGANHFSQANHPEVRKKLNAVFSATFTRNPQLIDAFLVRE